MISRPFIEVDLHGCRQDEAIKKIEAALKQVDAGTYHVRLIHGYNRGKSLMHMIQPRDHGSGNQGIMICGVDPEAAARRNL